MSTRELKMQHDSSKAGAERSLRPTSEIFYNYSPSIAARDLRPFLSPTSNHPQPLPDSGRDGERPNIVRLSHLQLRHERDR